MALSWLVVVLSAISVGTFLSAVAAFFARSPRPTADPWPERRPAPRLSVIVPARNEERSIGACVGAILAQGYPNLEVIVVDDASEDATARVVRQWAERDPRCRLVRSRALEPGWLGKNNALASGAAVADGDYLLFVDADVVLAPGAAAAGVLEMQRRGVALLSLWPYHAVRGVLASPVQSVMIGFNLFADAMQRVFGDPFPEALSVWGPFILVDAAAYARVGGHASVRGCVNEDHMLGRVFRRAGLPTAMLQGTSLVSVTMYTSLGELWSGWMKNLFPTLRSSYALALGAVLLVVAVTCGPSLALVLGALAGARAVVVLAAVLIALQLTAGAMVRRHVRVAPILALSPLGGAITAALFAASAVNAALGREATWKGRRLPTHRPGGAVVPERGAVRTGARPHGAEPRGGGPADAVEPSVVAGPPGD